MTTQVSISNATPNHRPVSVQKEVLRDGEWVPVEAPVVLDHPDSTSPFVYAGVRFVVTEVPKAG